MHSHDSEFRRLFIGLFPDKHVREAIQVHRCGWSGVNTRLPEPHRFHLTLQFLGDVRVERIPALLALLREVPMVPFKLALADPIVWKQGCAVLRAHSSPELLGLHAHMISLLRAKKFPGLSTFTPHVTLAWGAGGAIPPRIAPCIQWEVSEFLLVRSRFNPASHEILERYGPNNAKPMEMLSPPQLSLFS